MQNPAHIPRPERHEILLDQPGIAASDPEHFRAMKEGAPSYGSDRGIHAWRIAAAGEERDSFHLDANK
jgi:hypothetical protein